jgi:hypothetical protein
MKLVSAVHKFRNGKADSETESRFRNGKADSVTEKADSATEKAVFSEVVT